MCAAVCESAVCSIAIGVHDDSPSRNMTLVRYRNREVLGMYRTDGKKKNPGLRDETLHKLEVAA